VNQEDCDEDHEGDDDVNDGDVDDAAQDNVADNDPVWMLSKISSLTLFQK